ncbi:hypothetical protein Tco_0078044 [Tanacetum coccineum]
MKDKAPADSTNFERFIDADEPRQEKEEEIHHDAFSGKHANWFKQPGSTIMFAKKMRSFLNKDKIIKADVEGPKFEVLKNMFKNNVELEYNLEHCYLAMTGRIDWKNPEGDRFHTDLSKPLSLEGPPSRKTIPTRYFFNKYLEYLMHGNEERNMLSHCQR